MPDKTVAGKPTLDQRRAQHAWEAVQDIVRRYIRHENGKRIVQEEAKKFGGHAKKLPTRIMASGLGQALAFLRAKNYAPDLLTAVGHWVLDKRANPESSRPRPTDNALIEQLIHGNSDFLRRATDETLAYLLWLNRFAEAEGLMEGD